MYRKVVIAAFIVASSLFPRQADADLQCWPGGLAQWTDGYWYCMTDGSECEYCEVIDNPKNRG